MKKFTLLSILMLFATFAFAQKSVSFAPAKAFKMIENSQMLSKGVARGATHKAPRKGPEQVQPEGEGETWYILDGIGNIQNEFDAIAEGEMTEVQVLIEKDEIYIQGLAYWFPEAWVKGTIDGKTVTIPTGQYLDEDEYGPEYFIGYDIENGKITDVIFEYDSEEGLLTQDPNIYYLENAKEKELSYYTIFAGVVLSKEPPLNPEVVEPPFGLGEEWRVIGIPIEIQEVENEETGEIEEKAVYGEAEAYDVQVKIDGKDFYVQGISYYMPEAWVKGTIEDDKVTFATGQYLGLFTYKEDDYPMFFVGVGDEGLNDLVFTYDTEQQVLSAENIENPDWMILSLNPKRLSSYLQIYAVYYIAKGSVEDGITTVNNNKRNAVYYNLQGARIDKPTQKGIYIRNGKKMVVK